MTSGRIFCAAGAVAATVALVAMVGNPSRVKANDNPGKEDELIRIGFEIAPVPLKVDGHDWKAVGLGSYLVNALGSCNDCHSAGPQTQYLKGGNPYFGQSAKINPATYLGGGRDFGPIAGPDSPDIVSRNLTPDKTGRPAGGRTFEQFYTILRTGKDLDHLHPNCSATVTTDCLPPPFDGALLQIMPWPSYHHLTDEHIWAIYEYLSAIPCIESSPDPNNPLHNDCP
jgi:mono/diheme cytochrome c family protein